MMDIRAIVERDIVRWYVPATDFIVPKPWPRLDVMALVRNSMSSHRGGVTGGVTGGDDSDDSDDEWGDE